jgi:hypothetical protein
VRIEAHESKRLERLCRYLTRPVLSDERIQVNAAGQVQLELKAPWRDGTTHLVMSPLELMQRLAALVPRPRLHLTRYHGVLAPNAKLRARVVPQQPPAPGHAATEVAARAESEEVEPVRARSQRMGWALLLKRVFDIDMRRCPRCGGVQVKIIAVILERAVIGRILTHLEPQPPPRSRVAATARSKGQVGFAPISRLGSDPPLAPGQRGGVEHPIPVYNCYGSGAGMRSVPKEFSFRSASRSRLYPCLPHASHGRNAARVCDSERRSV